MGQDVNTRDIVKNGNRKLHSYTTGVRYEEIEKKCTIDSLDAALVATGERNILNFDNRLHESGDGVHFCLHNNLWGTNYMMWFGDDMKYRFVIKV
jgi:hypothetical protein